MDLLKHTRLTSRSHSRSRGRSRSRSRDHTPEVVPPSQASTPLSGDSESTMVACPPSITEAALVAIPSITLSTPQSFSVPPALSEAITRYIEDIPESDRNAFRSAGDILDKMREMDNEHRQSSLSRTVGTRIQKVLTCIHTFVGSVKVAIQHSPEISSLVVGGINCVLLLALGYIEFFETLTRMLERVGGHLSYLSKYASLLSQHTPDIQNALVKAYCDLLDLFVCVRGVFTNKNGVISRLTSFKIFFSLTWEPFLADFQLIQSRFLDHIEVVIREAEVQRRIDSIEISRRKQELKDKRRKEKKRTEILKWLSPEDFEESHRRHYSKRFGDTGQWFLDEERLRNWMSPGVDRSSLLWCHGMPGVGKSVLFSLALDKLGAEYQMSGDTGIAFAYCYYKTPLEPTTYIQVFIKQLCRMMDEIPIELEQLYDRHNRNASIPSFNEFQAIFLAVSKYFKRVFVLLDALDECTIDTRKILYQFFDSVLSSDLKLFIASRKEQDIERGFRLFPTIEIEATKVMADIEAYVTTRLDESILDGSLKLGNPTMKGRIKEALLSKAGGMFLWVDFQLQNIKSQRSDRAIEEALRSLPEDMHDTYERILLRIHEQPRADRELAKKVLMWIAQAKRPMKLDELAEAIAMSEGCKSYTELLFSVVNDKDTLVSVCRNLVVATHGNRRRIPANITVRFVHYSVQEYLCESPLDLGRPENIPIVSQYRFKGQAAHEEIAPLCLLYLINCKVDGRVPREYKYGGFFHYANTYWADHLRAMADIDTNLLQLLTEFFDFGCGLTPTCTVADSLHTACYVWHRAGTKSSLPIAALIFGLSRVVERLSADQFHYSFGENGTEILHYAVKNDCLRAAELLLNQGSDINAPDDDGAKPLFHAKSDSMTQLLLERGANPHIKDNHSKGPLRIKSFGPSENFPGHSIPGYSTGGGQMAAYSSLST